MFPKLAVLIVAVAATAASLLAARQMRTQAAHELAQTRLRVMRLDQQRAKLRSEIASRITPEHVQEMASRQSPLKPIAGEFPLPPSPSLIASVPAGSTQEARR
jgi:type II secretory pathway pseudopilin PulG